ncbi:glycosyltransferase family 2 protein [Acidobacteriota bacterium]
MNPIVSVVMPTYNHARYLSESIPSVMNQSFAEWELIIIDNFSEDDTETIVREFERQDPRIRYFQYSNKGIIAASRNYGIKQAQGDFVAFLDSDDIWLPAKLTDQMSVFETKEKTGLVYSKAVGFKDDGKLLHEMPKKVISGKVFFRLLKDNFIGCSTVIMRKSIFDEIGHFDVSPELVSVEDYELWMRCARDHSIFGVDKVLVKYRIHSQAVSSSREVEAGLRPLHALENVFKKLHVDPKIQKSVKSRWYTSLARKALYEDRFDDFKELSERALRLKYSGVALLQRGAVSLLGEKLLRMLAARKKKKRPKE